jgi:hypothetical protein
MYSDCPDLSRSNAITQKVSITCPRRWKNISHIMFWSVWCQYMGYTNVWWSGAEITYILVYECLVWKYKTKGCRISFTRSDNPGWIFAKYPGPQNRLRTSGDVAQYYPGHGPDFWPDIWPEIPQGRWKIEMSPRGGVNRQLKTLTDLSCENAELN